MLDRTFIADIVLFAIADGIPYNVSGPSITVPGQGPFGVLSIDLGSKTVINSLILDPSSPIEGADYVATSDIFCLPSNASVSISVLGTDGYEDSELYTVGLNQAQAQFVLTVPGAETGVQDIITLIITLPDGETIQRTTSLIFN